ncbi:MAG: hypothetical protein AAF353_16690, partial [Pseudomonadota bacterium]
EARVGGESDRDHQASVNLQHQLETGTLGFGFRSFLTPGGSGELLQTRTSSLSWDQSLSPRWSSQSEIEEIRNDGSDLLTTSRGDRRYRRFLQRFRYRIDREWSFDVAYRYRSQEYEDESGSASGSAVLLTLIYQARAPK